MRINSIDKVKRQMKKIYKKNTLAGRMKRWSTYTMVNTLNILRSNVTEEIKTHLYKFPDQIVNMTQKEAFLRPITIDGCKCFPSRCPPENLKEIRCRIPTSIPLKQTLSGKSTRREN
jgi:hypothetical protein